MGNKISNRRYLTAAAAYFDEDKIWVSNMDFNGLYYYEMFSGKTVFVSSFLNEKNDTWRLHNKIVKCENELYFIPDRSKYIHVFNESNKEMKAYDLSIAGRANCKNAICYKGKIYFASEAEGVLLCSIDTITKRIQKKQMNIKYNGKLCRDMLLVNECIYIALKEMDVVVKYSIEQDSFTKYEVSGDGNGFGTICFDGRFFWLSNSNGILQWDEENEKILSVKEFPKGFGMSVIEKGKYMEVDGFTNQYVTSEKPFEFSVLNEDNILFFPFRTNMIVKLDVKRNVLEEVVLEDEAEDEKTLSRKGRITACHYLGWNEKENLVFVSTNTKAIYIKNEMANKHERLKKIFLWAQEPENIPLYLKNAYLYEEELDGSLEDFLNNATVKDLLLKIERKNIGRVIYEYLKQ